MIIMNHIIACITLCKCNLHITIRNMYPTIEYAQQITDNTSFREHLWLHFYLYIINVEIIIHSSLYQAIFIN